MMKLWSVDLVALMAVVHVDAEAKRMGGGKSVGQQSSNVTQRESAGGAPSQGGAATNSAAAAKPATPAAAPAAPAPALRQAAQSAAWRVMLGVRSPRGRRWR